MSMQKAIVTTTINAPTEALKKFADIALKDDWTLIIVGDKKTPHGDYAEFVEKYEGAVVYLDCEAQEEISKELSDLIGWNCIQRRNFGFIYAYKHGAEILATIDDDNIPIPSWGKNCKVGHKADFIMYKSNQTLFDPLSVTHPNIWHRGFPIQMLDGRNIRKSGMKKREVLVQADFWDGDPDVDAVARITLAPKVQFIQSMVPIGSDKPSPFNSQNTFLSRKLFPDYFLFPHIGRMDDIWASYYIQRKFPESVIYSRASVFQARNEHDLSKDLENELIGYKHTLDWTKWCFEQEGAKAPDFLPEQSQKAFEVYRTLFK